MIIWMEMECAQLRFGFGYAGWHFLELIFGSIGNRKKVKTNIAVLISIVGVIRLERGFLWKRHIWIVM